MAVRFPLAIVISAVDAASPTLGKVESRIGKFARSGQILGRGLSMTATPAIAALGAVTFRVGADFEQSMLRIRAASGAGAEEIALLRAEAKKMASVGFSANEAAAAMTSFARAGVDAHGTLRLLKPTFDLATAAGVEVGDVSDRLINIMAGYKLSFAETTRVVDGLTFATDATTNSLDDLTQAFTMGGALAAASGEKFEDTLGILAMMGQANFRGTLGGTAVRGFLSDLSRIAMTGGSAIQAGVLRRHGLSARDLRDSTGQTLKMVDALELLEKHGIQGGELMLLFGERAGPGLQGVLNQGLPALRQLIADFGEKGVGSAAKKAALMLSGPEGALKKLGAEFRNLAIAIGESGFLQFVTDGVRKVTGWVQWMQKASPETLNFATKVVLAAAIAGPAIYTVSTAVLAVNSSIGLLVQSGFIGWLATASKGIWAAATASWAWTTAMLANPVSWVVIGVVALTAAVIALIYWWDDLWYGIRGMWNDFIELWQVVTNAVLAFAPLLENSLPEWLLNILTGDTLKFDLQAEEQQRMEALSRELDAAVRPPEGHVVVDFKNVPRGAAIEALSASGAFEFNTGYAMGGG